MWLAASGTRGEICVNYSRGAARGLPALQPRAASCLGRRTNDRLRWRFATAALFNLAHRIGMNVRGVHDKRTRGTVQAGKAKEFES